MMTSSCRVRPHRSVPLGGHCMGAWRNHRAKLFPMLTARRKCTPSTERMTNLHRAMMKTRNWRLQLTWIIPSRRNQRLVIFGVPAHCLRANSSAKNILIQHRTDMPVTGLERVEDTRPHQLPPRAPVRKCIARACDYAGLNTESHFMEELGGVVFLLKQVAGSAHLLPCSKKPGKNRSETRG